MDRNKVSCSLVFIWILLPLLPTVRVLRESDQEECCQGMTSQRFTQLAQELISLERELLQSLGNWEYEFVNTETTKLYHMEIIDKLIQKLDEVDKIFSFRLHLELSVDEHTTNSIKRTLETVEQHFGKLQILDSLLMIDFQKKFSQSGLENVVPSLRFTRPPLGKTWRFLQPGKSIRLHLVFFNNYNFKALHQSVSSITTSAAYNFLEHSVKCLFVLGKPRENPKSENVKRTLEIIKHVRFCKTMIWKMDEESVQVNSSISSWWFIMETIFGKRNSQGMSGYFQEYQGDILFLEEDVILSEDVLDVAWFASLVKNTLPDIWQFALGGDGGVNTVNAHPDTFVVKKAVKFLGKAYGFNASIWKRFWTMKRQLLQKDSKEWNVGLGKVITAANEMRAYHVVTPTLARVHLPHKNEKLPWSLATRTIDMSLATVNKGIRDIYGFLCESSVLVPVDDVAEAECPCSNRKWNVKKSKQMACVVQPYHVDDPCFSGNYLQLG